MSDQSHSETKNKLNISKQSIDDKIAPIPLEDLLSNTSEWVNIHDIIRISFKAVYDIFKHQAKALKELEYILSSKSNNAEVQRQLNLKANVTDMGKTFEQISKQLENRPTYQEIESSLEEKVSSEYLSLQLSKKVSSDEAKAMIENDYYKIEQKRDYTNLKTKIDDLSNLVVTLNNNTGSKKDIEQLSSQMDEFVKISEFNEQISQKASKQSITNALNRKVNKSDLDVILVNKADLTSFEELQSQINFKVSSDHFETQINKILETRIERQEIFNLKEQISLKLDVQRYEELLNELRNDRKNDDKNVKVFSQKNQEFVTQVNQLIEQLMAELENKVSKKDSNAQMQEIEASLNTFKINLELHESKMDNQGSKLDNFATVEEVREAINELRNDFGKHLKDLRDNVTTLDKCKANVESTIEALALKADAELVEKVLNSKALKDEVKNLQVEMRNLSDNKAEKESYDTLYKHVKAGLEDLHREVALKSNIKDVCKLMDLKANVKWVESVLKSQTENIESRVQLDNQNLDKERSGQILDVLVSENCLARWVWRSGELRTGQAIPWEVQTANTNTSNQVWEENRTSVLVVQEGLYELTFGFQSKKKQGANVHVNGDLIICATAGHATLNTKAPINKHNSNVTGLTHIEYITLTPKSRISFNYTGEGVAEGFFGLKKL